MPFVNGKWVTEDDSTATQLNKLTASDSPYIKQARSSGMQTAGRRGLINSSIAAGNAEGAAIQAALPIASQDAGQLAAKNSTYQQAGYAADQLATQVKATSDLQKMQTQAAKDLAAQQAAAQSQLAKDQAGYDVTKLTTQGQLDADRQNQIIASNDKNAALAATTAANTAYLNAFTALADNKDLPLATRDSYINDLKTTRASGLDMVQQIYGVELNWPGKPAPPPPAGSAPPAPAPTPVAPPAPGGMSLAQQAALERLTANGGIGGVAGIMDYARYARGLNQ